MAFDALSTAGRHRTILLYGPKQMAASASARIGATVGIAAVPTHRATTSTTATTTAMTPSIAASLPHRHSLLYFHGWPARRPSLRLDSPRLRSLLPLRVRAYSDYSPPSSSSGRCSRFSYAIACLVIVGSFALENVASAMSTMWLWSSDCLLLEHRNNMC